MITRKEKLSEDSVVTQPSQAYFCATFFIAAWKQFQLFLKKIIDVPSTDTKMNHVFLAAEGLKVQDLQFYPQLFTPCK